MTDTQHYEDVAAAFYQETGVMAPGKDRPAASGCDDPEQLRYKLWTVWCELRASRMSVRYE